MVNINNTTLTLRCPDCPVCGLPTREYWSYETIIFRTCPNNHNHLDIKKYSATTTRQQKVLAEIEPVYGVAFNASNKREKGTIDE